MNKLVKKHNLITVLFYSYVLISFVCFYLVNLRIDTINNRIDYLENQIDTIKNEAVIDYQSYIQLQNENK